MFKYSEIGTLLPVMNIFRVTSVGIFSPYTFNLLETFVSIGYSFREVNAPVLTIRNIL